ncbi:MULTISPECIES: preprotein translocase subunit SecE [Marinifilum]|jgi:preprotein translocase subunit SecE|uniref:Protein translocase subunit SecE n=1 Tax=Marinifilum breve TaxID=2184082 RepID=A0A2V4A2K9_9BACT|nr:MULTISPECIES: preprotein translocase subunit SecE [Marinifilum]MCY1633365.1 preprotein translocase subunit SecE [Marinifilum sp. D737]MDQ2178231.1 preprotein translocase subunit SecE [Marinifilum sp. D714]PXY01570.1 preprotein translocase subunit SecE [Marinifilum breve]
MKLKIYIEEVYKELVQKVSWPSWSELQSSAIVVMIASTIIALVIFLMDMGFKNLMDFIYNMLH